MRMAILGGAQVAVVEPVSVSDTPLSADRNPSLVYLATLAPGSRRTMRTALDAIARMIAPTTDAVTFPWYKIEYHHAAAIRVRLAETYAHSTANKMIAAMKGALKHTFNLGLMGAEQYAKASSISSVRGHRVPKGRALGSGELRALFESCDPARPGGARNIGLLAILYGCGMRRSEAVGLDLADFDATTGALTIKGKGNKERFAYLTNGARHALDAWLAHRGREPGPLFLPVDQRGTIFLRRMSDQAVLDLVVRLARRAKIPKFSPHDLRRSFISDALDAGADIASVAALAGHSQVTTTSRYDRRGERARRRAAETIHVPFTARCIDDGASRG